MPGSFYAETFANVNSATAWKRREGDAEATSNADDLMMGSIRAYLVRLRQGPGNMFAHQGTGVVGTAEQSSAQFLSLP